MTGTAMAMAPATSGTALAPVMSPSTAADAVLAAGAHLEQTPRAVVALAGAGAQLVDGALRDALEARPAAQRVLGYAMVNLRDVLYVYEPDSRMARRAMARFRDDLRALEAELLTDPGVAVIFPRSGGVARRLLYGLLLFFGRPDAALGVRPSGFDLPYVLSRVLPGQQTEVRVDEEGLPYVRSNGTPAERKRLAPVIDYIAKAAGSPQNTAGRKAEDGGRAPAELRRLLGDALPVAYRQSGRGRITVAALAKLIGYSRPHLSTALRGYGVDMARLAAWRPNDPSPFD